MGSTHVVEVVVTVGVYVALIGFVLYRQMSSLELRLRRLVLLPAVIGLFALQQLSREPPAIDLGAVGFLAANLALGVLTGLWRGTTFRLWIRAGVVMIRGTAMTLVSWGVLLAVRLPFAAVSRRASYPQGLVVGELLLALAVTFAAQNVVVWLRARRLVAVAAETG